MAGRRPRSWPNEFKRLFQSNLGRSRRAQDLLFQTIRESEVALAVVAEPYRVPDATNWVGDLDGLAAITWTTALSTPGVVLDRGSGYVAVEWDGMAVVGVYVSPNSGLAAFEDFLDGVGECVRRCLPDRCSSSGISTPTPRSGEILGRTPETSPQNKNDCTFRKIISVIHSSTIFIIT